MATVTTTPKPPQKHGHAAPEKIRPDLNLEKWAIWQPSKSKASPREKTLRRVFDLADGRKVTAEVEVGFTNKGALTTEDQKTFYALLKLWEDKGRSTEQTYYSLRRLAKILKKRWGTNVIEATSESLLRLRITPLIWKNSYHNSAEQETIEILDPFNILSDLKIVRRKTDGHITQEFGYFKFNDFILKNILAHYTKPVLIETVLGFRSEIAQLLYTHLDLIMARRPHYERNTHDLLYEDLGLEGESYRNPSNRKQLLERALTELRGVRLTTGVITSATIEKTKDGKDYKVIFHKGSPQHVSRGTTTPEHRDAEPHAALMDTDGAPDEREPLTTAEALPPVVTIPTDRLSAAAHDIVGHFYKRFFKAEKPYPPSKAINQAIALIAQHGEELARYVVDFSYKVAPETGYQPQTFGGILQYTSRALAAYEREHAHAKAAQAAAREEKLRDHYERYRDQEIDRIISTTSPEELIALETSLRAELLAEGTKSFMLDRMVQVRRDNLLAGRAGVLSYTEWRVKHS